MKKICVINGVNLNFTGIREKDIYGAKTLAEINEIIKSEVLKISGELKTDITIDFFQSNIEGEIINYLQKCYFDKADGIVINPGAYTHYSYAIRDAISSISIPVIEVHMSNVHSREEFRHTSVLVPVCKGQVSGFGAMSYILAIRALVS